MGGAADLPQRSSSPLKRRASDLDGEAQSSQKDDVDMITVPTSDPPDPHEAADASTTATRSKRAQSVDMLKSEDEDAVTNVSTEESPDATPAKTAETGMAMNAHTYLRCSFLT